MPLLSALFIFFTDLQRFRAFTVPLPSWHVITQSPPARRAGSTVHQCHSKYFSRHAREEGESRMHEKSRGTPKQLAVRTGQTQTMSQHPHICVLQRILVSTEEPKLQHNQDFLVQTIWFLLPESSSFKEE